MDIKEFTGIIKNSIDKEGLFPHIGYGITKDDKVDINNKKAQIIVPPRLHKINLCSLTLSSTTLQ